MEKVGWWATSILDDTNLEQGYEYDYTLYIYMGTANLRGYEGIQETSPKHGKSCEHADNVCCFVHVWMYG